MTIRLLTEYDELRRGVEFQHAIWGAQFGEIVPAAILWSASMMGGIAAGAFDADEMVGFLFGLTGWKDGRPAHWSDMLAVLPAYRGRGIGRRLKQFQRDVLLQRGITTCSWTFDPLEARNAHLNLSRLGAIGWHYVRDCYGVSDSPLHAGLPTDRLIAEWLLDSDRVRQRMEAQAGTVAWDGASCINPDGGEPRLDLEEDRLQLLIPADIQLLKAIDFASARAWRDRTRAAFEAYLPRGYAAVEVQQLSPSTSAYLLSRTIV